jgi:hypothetical protein
LENRHEQHCIDRYRVGSLPLSSGTAALAPFAINVTGAHRNVIDPGRVNLHAD